MARTLQQQKDLVRSRAAYIDHMAVTGMFKSDVMAWGLARAKSDLFEMQNPICCKKGQYALNI